jgi:DNA-binding HxlR family transcriptional regulator
MQQQPTRLSTDRTLVRPAILAIFFLDLLPSTYESRTTMTIEVKNLHNPWVLKIAARLRHGALGFNAIERAIEAPNPPMLSHVLKKMQRDGLIVRTVYDLAPPARTDYRLTELGHTIAKASAPLLAWVDQNIGHVENCRAQARLAAKAHKGNDPVLKAN